MGVFNRKYFHYWHSVDKLQHLCY